MLSGLSQSLEASYGPVASYAVVAVVVFALLVALLVALKFLGRRSSSNVGRKGPRLAVVDALNIDQRRKLVLVRRDEVEHLVLIGGQNDLLIEREISRNPAALRRPPASAAVTSERRPAALAPEAHHMPGQRSDARSASPLRRPIPAPPEDRAPRLGPVAAPFPPATAQPAAHPEPATALEPRAEAGAFASTPRVEMVPRPDEPAAPAPEPAVGPAPPAAEAKLPEAPAVVPALRRPLGAERRPASDAAMRIPPFLRRAEPQLAPPPAPEERGAAPLPESTAEPDASAARRAPTAFDGPPVNAAAAAPAAADVPAVIPAAELTRVAPAVEAPEPVAAPERRPDLAPPPVEPPAPPPAAPAPAERSAFGFPAAKVRISPKPFAPIDPQPATAEPAAEEADRRPLSVRSFASVIQTRRLSVEAPRPAAESSRPAAEERPRPADPAPPTAPIIAATGGTAAVLAPAAPASELEDDLARELDTGLGSLDWPDEPSPRAEAPPAPEAAAPAIAPPEPPAKPPRPLTLEEEMERLLGDFDLSVNRKT